MDKKLIRKRKRGFAALLTALALAIQCLCLPAWADGANLGITDETPNNAMITKYVTPGAYITFKTDETSIGYAEVTYDIPAAAGLTFTSDLVIPPISNGISYQVTNENASKIAKWKVSGQTVSFSGGGVKLTLTPVLKDSAKTAIDPTVSITGWTYGDTANTPSVTGNTGEGAVTYEYKVKSGDTYSATVPSAAGEYTVKATIAATEWYQGGTATADFTIAQKEVGLTWGTTTFEYDGSPHAPTATATELVGTDTVTVTVTGEAAAAGTHTATATALSNNNYKLPAVNTQNFVITQKEVGLSWSPASFEYDGTAHVPAATATGIATGDTVTVTVTGAETAAGTSYTATATALSNNNYKLPEVNTQSFDITQKEVGLSWSPASFEYDGTAHVPAATATGIATGDTVTVTVTGEAAAAGTHTATATALYNDNYKLPSTVTNSFDITKKAVTIKAADQTVTVDGTIVTGTNKVSVSSGSLAAGHSISAVTLTGSDTSAATTTGTITPSAAEIMDGTADVTANYNITYENGTLTVTELPTYTITWKDDDGSVLKTDTGVVQGTTPSYGAADPAKPADAQYTYAFSAWTPAIAAATADAAYTATYTKTPVSYTLKWDADGGTIPAATAYTSGTVAYNTAITKPADPTKTGYTFAGWTPAVSARMPAADTTYKATWTEVSTTVTTTTTTAAADPAPETSADVTTTTTTAAETTAPATTAAPETTTAPAATTAPETTTAPAATTAPETTTAPAETTADTTAPAADPVITAAVEAVNEASEGGSVTVSLTDNILPASLIEAIKGRDVDLVIELANGVKWTINGNSVTGNDIGNVDLSVSFDNSGIPVDVINKVTGERWSLTVHLDFDGEFGFEAVMTIDLQKKNAGYYANLFYYNPATGGLEFVSWSIIDENGNADLKFVHASDYTIIIDDKPMDGSTDSANGTRDGNPATGVASAGAAGLAALTALCAAAVLKKKRK